MRERLGTHVFGADAETIEAVIQRWLVEHDATIAVGESCTGGRIASALTATPGASKTFLGAVVAYDYAVKIAQLGVRPETLAQHGAVSEATVLEMARGVRERLGTTYGLSVTGIAGPEGGTPEKPVGLVWFGFAGPQAAYARSFTFRGDRGAIQRRASVMALGLLWYSLEFNPNNQRLS